MIITTYVDLKKARENRESDAEKVAEIRRNSGINRMKVENTDYY